MNAWDHPLIKKGMPAQLEKRRARIAAGERPLGWKVGLGAPAAMERLGLKAPVVGYLMQRALRVVRRHRVVRRLDQAGGGSRRSACAWPAICPAARRPRRALAAVKEIFPAIELADFDPPPTPDNIDVVLEGDIYQRHVVLCGNTRFGGSVAGLTSRADPPRRRGRAPPPIPKP